MPFVNWIEFEIIAFRCKCFLAYSGNPKSPVLRGALKMKKTITTIACLALGSVMSFGIAIPNAHAARGVKVDCAQVMQDLNAGKKPRAIATEMKISTSSVYKCRRRARGAAATGTAHSKATHPKASASPAA
jgi:hypothetical protein